MAGVDRRGGRQREETRPGKDRDREPAGTSLTPSADNCGWRKALTASLRTFPVFYSHVLPSDLNLFPPTQTTKGRGAAVIHLP